MNTFYSNGKLLITGEYLVLDGATSLALPTQKGQTLAIKPRKESTLVWESYDENNDQWLQVEFDLPGLRIISETFDSEIEDGSDSLALKLLEVLLSAKQMNPQFLTSENGFNIKSSLDFSRKWGLGSSSTLVNNIAQWAEVDAFNLQFKTFGGSAYDIACAQNNTPILYQLKDQKPSVDKVIFDPKFKDQLYFVHLNKKQNSREGIARYKNFKGSISTYVKEVSSLTKEIVSVLSIVDFEHILAEHERIIGAIIHKKPIQQTWFSDYFGQTKSLGAWGGDFILATGNDDTPNYFKNKGFATVIPYQEIIL